MRSTDKAAAADRRGDLTLVRPVEFETATTPRTGRRWDDRPGDLPAMTFARFLTTKPALDDVARFLVALLCWPIGAEGAVVVRTSSGGVEMVARYVDQVPGWLESGEPDDLPPDVEELVAATGGTHPTIWTDADDPDRRPMGAWPLGSPAGPVGVLALFLAAPLDPSLVASRVRKVSEILAVYLAGSGADAPRTAATSRRSAAPQPGSQMLTARQRQVLEFMALGLTNPQIAMRIGFSDSTVRMESMAIYRALGVHDRRHAIAVGRALGLLDPE